MTTQTHTTQRGQTTNYAWSFDTLPEARAQANELDEPTIIWTDGTRFAVGDNDTANGAGFKTQVEIHNDDA